LAGDMSIPVLPSVSDRCTVFFGGVEFPPDGEYEGKMPVWMN